MKTEGRVLSKCGWQHGLTLIEIMVALLIGSFLLAGVIQIFIVNKQTYRVQENLSRMQENGRFSIDYLNRYIRLSGYIANEPFLDIKNKNQNKRGTLTSEIFPPTNPAITGINDNPASLNDSDSITIRFQGNPAYNPMTDCLGNVINSPNGNVIATNQFLIPTGLQDNNLYCITVHNTATGAVVAGSAQTQPVIEGVENMQIRYCMRTSIPNNFSCVAANNVTNWSAVQNVRISLLVRSSDDNLVNQSQSYQFDTDGDGVDETITPTDRRLRRVFTTTITLRNLLVN